MVCRWKWPVCRNEKLSMSKIKIYIGRNNGLPNVDRSFDFLKSKLEKHLDSVVVIDSDSDEFEYPALKKMWDDSQKEDFFGLYLHCKASSKENEDEFQNGLAWLEYMLFGLVDNMELCLDHLSKGADLVGSMWYRHFKGNCFWFRSEYIRGLMNPMTMDIKNRYHAEYWCAQNYWWGGYRYPMVKNLFYIPLSTDNDFIHLKRNKYIPNINERNRCCDIGTIIKSNNYTIFNDIELSYEDSVKYKSEIIKFSNYDSVIKIK